MEYLWVAKMEFDWIGGDWALFTFMLMLDNWK